MLTRLGSKDAGLVFHIDIQPHQPGNAEDVDEICGQKNAQQAESGRLAPAHSPVKQRDKKQAEPARPDIADKHGAVVVAGLREVVEATFRAAVEHVKRFDKRPGARFKSFAFVALRAFEVKNAV